MPWGTPLPVSSLTEPDLLRIARETQQPYVSDLFQGTVAKRLIFSVSVPVRKGEEIPYALVMSLEPDRLVEILTGESLPPGWLAAVSDRKNLNMARTRLAKEFLGRPIPEESVRQYAGRPEGVIETTRFRGPALAAGLSLVAADGLAGGDMGAAVAGRGTAAAGMDAVLLVRRGAAVALAPRSPSASAG